MVAAAVMFWILLTCASCLYIVLHCMKRKISATHLVDNLLFSFKLRSKFSDEIVHNDTKTKTTENKSSDDDDLSDEKEEIKQLSGPLALPLIGSLYKLGSKGGPFEAFTNMSKTYGDIYQLQLGVSKCVVVSSYKLIKEVLITKGSDFGGRPDFVRFHHLFGGDRNNSLALCDWSDLQRKRRSIARVFCSPRGGSSQQEAISQVAVDETHQMLDFLEDPSNAGVLSGEQPVKPIILAAVSNMFTKYMCSTRFGYKNKQFNRVVRRFDDIFWDINQGYAVDFLPWLKIFYNRHLHRLSDWANEIRGFILERIIEPKRESLDLENEIPRDFTDALLFHLESSESGMSWEHILFELEDFLGGHSAVGNLVMMILANAVTHPEIQTKVQAECDSVFEQKLSNGQSAVITPEDKHRMPYTEAIIWETLRVASSPIVPHVATCDTKIGGYQVGKDTVVFLNNYELNLGENYWGADAKEFKPERFLKPVTNEDDATSSAVQNEGERTTTTMKLSRPDFFVPFSTGKRTCIGQKLVQGFAFVIVTMLLSKYNISAPANVDVTKSLTPSCLALPPECFNLVFEERRQRQATTSS